MDFLEDLEAYNSSMENAYMLVTKRMTLDDIYELMEDGEVSEFYLPFDPMDGDGRDNSTIDLLIEYFISIEEYEKCQELVTLRNKFLGAQ
tara:strand:- start:530 stop:799 length:270 start_codon:yes stop_codon:yes gene_type:complete